MGTESFPEIKRPGRGVDHPPLSSAEVKEIVKLYIYSPSGPPWPVLGWTLLHFTIFMRSLFQKFDTLLLGFIHSNRQVKYKVDHMKIYRILKLYRFLTHWTWWVVGFELLLLHLPTCTGERAGCSSNRGLLTPNHSAILVLYSSYI